MQGEAYFDVAHLNGRPFIVRTREAEVRVLGTSFNVSAYPENLETTVIVAEGEVAFRPHDYEKPVILKKKHRAAARAGEAPVVAVVDSLDAMFAWLDGGLIFEATPLGEVARVLERWYDITISFDDADLKSRRFTARFEDESVRDVLKAISLALGLDYRVDGRETLLREDALRRAVQRIRAGALSDQLDLRRPCSVSLQQRYLPVFLDHQSSAAPPYR